MQHSALASLGVMLLFICLPSTQAVRTYCKPNEICWPNATEVQSLADTLNETIEGAPGVLLTPDDPRFPNGSLTFNYRVAKVPGLIAIVTGIPHIKAVIRFVKKYNIKLSIISSGHSFLGRCADEGALQMSVHYMKGINVDLNCTEWADGCMDVQPGVQWGEAYREADKHDRVVVGGSNPTVSVSGWTFGGGHSPLTRLYGLGTQNTLGFQLITADLNIVAVGEEGMRIDKPDGSVENVADNSLWWALRGGGSSYGVVIGMRIKMHPAPPGGVTQFVCTHNAVDAAGKATGFQDIWTKMRELYLKLDRNTTSYWVPSVSCNEFKQCAAYNTMSLVHMGSADTVKPEQFSAMMDFAHNVSRWQPGGCQLNKYGSFYEYEMLAIPNSTYTNMYLGGSLIPKSVYESNVKGVELIDLAARTAEHAYKEGVTWALTGVLLDGYLSENMEAGDSPLHIGWKNAFLALNHGTFWDPRLIDGQSGIQLVKDFERSAQPYSNGRYFNEASDDLEFNDYVNSFWGLENYNRLLDIKRRFDPENIFTCHMCIGDGMDPVQGENDVFG